MKHLLKWTVGRGILALVSGGVSLQAGDPVASDSRFPPLPEGVASFGAATLDDWLYVYGGHRGERHRYNAEDVSGAFHRLNLSGGRTWERLPDSQPVQGTSLAVEVYDTVHGTWLAGLELPDGPMKGFGCAAAVCAGRLYVSGMKGALYRLSIAADVWEPVGQLEHPGFFHRLVPVGRAGLLALGGEDSESKRNDLEFLRLASPETALETTRLADASTRVAALTP